MNDAIKNPIARKLVWRVTAVLAGAFMLLLAGAYYSLNREIRMKGEQYTKALVGVYSDLIVYESTNLDRPVDLSFSDRYTFFGEYMCSWYKVDCIYAYVPDFEEGTITFLTVVKNRKKFDEAPLDHMVGEKMEYRLSESEMRAWNDSTQYALVKSGRFGKGTDVMLRISDSRGNKAMVGADMAVDDLRREVVHGFHVVALFMFAIIALLALLLNLLIRKMVSDPARRISKKMADYISEGKRSKIRLETDDDDEFSMMAGAFNHMTEEMDKYIEDIARLGREQERQQAEVDIASEIQKGILPSGNASLPSCNVKAVMRPAKYIGGDLYDYFEIDGTHTMAVVADVSGKGLSSAMLMAVVLTLIRQFARLGYSPAGILRHVNDTLSEENPRMMFVTAFLGIYDSGTGVLTYANAGHNPSYLIHDVPVVLDGSSGTPLGLFQGEEYADVKVRLEQGDSVFLYTDGVNETVSDKGEFFGTDRLEAVLAETATTPEKDYIGSVKSSLRAFAGEAEQSDDITMLVLTARDNPVLELDYRTSEFALIRERLFESGLPKPLLMDLCVAAEECFVNICNYAFDGEVPEGEKILFSLKYSNKVVMRFSDGGRQFDPRCDLPDTNDYDIDTAVGGLGRLIAFTVADSVDYEYSEGRNILTITKSIN